jgi:sigma-B regulation protein RsbU (phosphoserine phosphatase)
VIIAEDGQQAWDRFCEQEIDIVLTDWEMPNISGVELVQRIRAARDRAFVYVIMLTSRSDKADLVKGIEAGADDYVSKPFDKEELRVRLLAGERIVRLERTLIAQNNDLRAAGERIRRDLDAAARVQRAMLPNQKIDTPHVHTAWTYVPTDELAGDAIGMHLVDERYLVAYVLDVSGHGVPAALLAVTAMHELSPLADRASLVRDMDGSGATGTVIGPALVASGINKRFASSDNDGRFVTMVLCVLDTHTGGLHFTSAGHPLPVVVRGGMLVPVHEAGGLPLAVIADAVYDDAIVQLKPGDRIYLFSDGIFEQADAAQSDMFGLDRLTDELIDRSAYTPEVVVAGIVQLLSEWAGGGSFKDDVSLVAIEWRG